jgi:hypothetical protein
MKTLSQELLDKVVGSLPAFIHETLKKYPVTLAGGYIRAVVAGEEPKDWDLFVGTLSTAEMIVEDFQAISDQLVFKSPNAITFRFADGGRPIQIITRWLYDKPEDVVASFDFTIAQAGIWWDGAWCSCCADTFVVDTQLEQLVYTAPVRHEDCAGSLNRIFKFVKRGYSIDAHNLSAVVARVAYKTYQEYHIEGEKNTEDYVAECIHREIARTTGNRY